MSHFEHTIHIDASPEAIWRAWTDIASWPQWTPTIPTAEPLDSSPFGVGKQARLAVKGGGSGIFTVTECEPNRRFAWANDYRGVHTVATHIVGTDGSGAKVTLLIDFSGFMSVLFSPMISRVAKANLPQEAGGLKRHCESS